MSSGHEELWIKHRPTTFDEVVGQDDAVNLLRGYIENNKVPHAILFTGPSGTGKSTLARIIANEMGCKGLDFNIINCAIEAQPLNCIRELQRQVKSSPSANSKCRVWILEEIQSWSRAGFAQQALLLMLEDDTKASHRSYIFGCTTNPEKLKKTVRNRYKKICLKTLAPDDMRILLEGVAKKEGRIVPEAVMDKIIFVALGSPREAVNQLDSALAAGSEEEDMLAAVGGMDEDNDIAWKLMKTLMYERPVWKKVAAAIREVTDDHDDFRLRILGLANSEMLKCTKLSARAYLIADVFSKHWYDCKPSGLSRACWEVVVASNE